MSIEPEITFRNMESSDAIIERVKERVDWLTKVNNRLTHLRVTIEAPHRARHKGKIYHVRLIVGVPGEPDFVINNEPETNHAHEDVYVAIRDAFDAARRRLQELADIRSGKTKTHRG
jgi:ribosome-associated translation inhibitor RaiA